MKHLASALIFWMPVKAVRKRWRTKLAHWLYARKIVSKAKCVGKNFRVGDVSSVTRQTEIGDNVGINGLHIFGEGRVIIGSHVQMGPEVLILTQSHDYKGDELPYGDGYILKDVIIGDSVWIGARVTILPGAKIGEGAIVQAGSVVHGEIPPCAIIGGNPAKVFAWRDKEHYEHLKALGRFRRW